MSLFAILDMDSMGVVDRHLELFQGSCYFEAKVVSFFLLYNLFPQITLVKWSSLASGCCFLTFPYCLVFVVASSKASLELELFIELLVFYCYHDSISGEIVS